MLQDFKRKVWFKKIAILSMACFLFLTILTSCSLLPSPNPMEETMNKQPEAMITEGVTTEPVEEPTDESIEAPAVEPTLVPVETDESTPSLKDILKDILEATVTDAPKPKTTDGAEWAVKPTEAGTSEPTETPAKPVATPKPMTTSKPTATPAPTPKPTTNTSTNQTSTAMITPPPIGKNVTLEEYADLIISYIIDEDMSKVEKVKAVHDYIVLNTEYDQTKVEDIPKISFAVEGVLFERVAVCQGYAYTFQLFMDLLDITSNVVVGTAIDSGIGHAWNMVYLGEKWYMVDTTWDDPIMENPEDYPEGILRYNYFLMPDSVLSIDHRWNKNEYPVCNSEKYMYYIYEDNIIDSIDDYEKEFIERYLAGQRTITLLYPEEGKPSYDFMKNYDYLLTKTATGYTYGWSATPPWRLGEYTVFTVEVD